MNEDQLRPRRTHLSNKVWRLAGGTEDNDLWTRMTVDGDGQHVVCSTFVPTDEQRRRIAAGENIELVVWGGVQPPVAVRLDDTALGKSPRLPESCGKCAIDGCELDGVAFFLAKAPRNWFSACAAHARQAFNAGARVELGEDAGKQR